MLRVVASRQGVDSKKLEEAEKYFAEVGRKQGGLLTIENFKSANCPNLK
jgi:hypothetical protein